MSARTVGWTVLGTVAGALLGVLLLVPFILFLQGPVGWDDFPAHGGPLPWVMGLVVLWLAYLGGRFGYKVGTYEEPGPAGEVEERTWSGPGWKLTIATDGARISTVHGTQHFSRDRVGGIFLVRTGRTWQLELPDDSLRVLDDLSPAEAEEITAALGRAAPS